MAYALRVVGVQMPQGLTRVRESNRYIGRFDVTLHDGDTAIPTFAKPSRAAVFPTVTMALDYYRTQSAVVPLRDDGLPNRPLTTLTVEIVTVTP